MLLEAIGEIYEGRRRVYGAPRTHQELVVRGHDSGRHRVARLMRRNGLEMRRRRRL